MSLWHGRRSSQRQRHPGRRARALLRLFGGGVLVLAGACVPVRPEQRAILADKVMQFAANARAEAALYHAIENREGSLGGGVVQGGGCGCN